MLPPPIVEKAVSSFTNPGGHVIVLSGPSGAPVRSRPLPPAHPDPTTHPHGLIHRLDDVLAAIRRRRRIARLLHPDSDTSQHTRPRATPETVVDHRLADGPRRTTPRYVEADLVITAISPQPSGEHTNDRFLDQVMLLAARLLCTRGVLAVFTHSDWTRGRLVDPTGPIVAAAQNADLLYLQHIIALHTPVRGGRLSCPPSATSDEEQRRHHRAAVRGLPVPHRRVHSDVLVFTQPRACPSRPRQPTHPSTSEATNDPHRPHVASG